MPKIQISVLVSVASVVVQTANGDDVYVRISNGTSAVYLTTEEAQRVADAIKHFPLECVAQGVTQNAKHATERANHG